MGAADNRCERAVEAPDFPTQPTRRPDRAIGIRDI